MEKARVIQQLRNHETRLKDAGIEALFLFGSVARGSNDAFSDIDLAASFNASKVPTPLDRGSAICEIETILGTRAFDLADLDAIKPAIKSSFDSDKIRVF